MWMDIVLQSCAILKLCFKKRKQPEKGVHFRTLVSGKQREKTSFEYIK